MKLKSLLLALVTAAAAFAADSTPIFNAILSTGTDQRFVLVSGSGSTSSWLKLGETFDGYALKSYDPTTGMLELSRNGTSTKVPLVNGAGVAVSNKTATPATLADAEEVFRVMRFDEMMNKMLDQQKKAMAPMFQQMISGKNMSADDKVAYGAFQQKVMDEMMGTMLNPEVRQDMAKIYSQIFTKEELTGLTAFYVTPTGQALLAKQPEIQQKMMSVITPRMMAVMPKIQQMGKDFSAEMQARKEANAGAAAKSNPPTAP
jgi:hypothetical protein